MAGKWIGFGKDMEKSLLEATSPFTFHVVSESHVMRFLKLIQCDNGKIGAYTKLVKDRNETAHSNGNIFFSTEAAIWPARRIFSTSSRDLIKIGMQSFAIADLRFAIEGSVPRSQIANRKSSNP